MMLKSYLKIVQKILQMKQLITKQSKVKHQSFNLALSLPTVHKMIKNQNLILCI